MSSGSRGGLSKDTQALVAQMMADSKLTAFQRRQLEAKMKAGKALPTKVDPTSSAQRPDPTKRQAGARKPARKPSVDKIQHRKPLSAIVSSTGGYARPKYEAQPGKDRGLAREQLADELAFGKDIAQAKQAIREKGRTASRASTTAQPPQRVQTEPQVDLFDILVQEIEERQEHLNELRQARHDPQAIARVKAEISQRIRQLELLDRQRSQGIRKHNPA
ncbi:hypothetical protein PTSG_12150 [Salpingoeca rosetta]|uniref:Uncharacterized protein n=1 Tax=Salpingoeca rosetta (strain ATCC 50818 / BSB-021) TaxID=946362 RepID=F2U748_SALR5|nr:uncharacterized protein PTSG_12150 [Salpingoeca rosetta]EGD83680.1 hypothetical protein PTSG_12150 [Salpingoeca rosetta]|eukprot:XP_004995184.1 hypothetical protein PTSG_12150 [Salpingoeca rosetta]